MNQEQVIMPFGKYKGRPVDQVPAGYLKWLADNADLYGRVQEAVYRQVGKPIPVKPSGELPPELDWLREAIGKIDG